MHGAIKVILASTNHAKYELVTWLFEKIKIEILPLPKEKLKIIVEDGKTAGENAMKKALAYSEDITEVVLAIDNALVLNGVDPADQPRERVKKFGDKMDVSQSEEEVIAYYEKLFMKYGGSVSGYWDYACCLAFRSVVLGMLSFSSNAIKFSSQRCQHKIAGYPLSVFQKDPELDMYIAMMSTEEQKEYRKKSLGNTLPEFVQQTVTDWAGYIASF